MDINQLSRAVIALADHKIGTKEAATLFASIGGATVEVLAGKTGSTKPLINARLQTLRSKGLVTTRYSADRTAFYQPSQRGNVIINQTLKAAQ